MPLLDSWVGGLSFKDFTEKGRGTVRTRDTKRFV